MCMYIVTVLCALYSCAPCLINDFLHFNLKLLCMLIVMFPFQRSLNKIQAFVPVSCSAVMG